MIFAKSHRTAAITLPWPLKPTFNYLSDVDSYSSWQLRTEAAGWLTRNRHQVGTSFFVRRSEWVEPIRVTVAENLPGRRKTFLLSIAGKELALTLEFFGVADTTTVTVAVNGRIGAGAVFKALLRDLEHLRYLLEDEESTSAAEKMVRAADAVATGLSPTWI